MDNVKQMIILKGKWYRDKKKRFNKMDVKKNVINMFLFRQSNNNVRKIYGKVKIK